jgi:hypothetical protein
MKILRDADGLRFIGECTPKGGFVSCDVECLLCGRRIDPNVQGSDIALTCGGCGYKARVFWSEADMHVYVAEQWGHLRKACTQRSVSTVRSTF